MGLGLIERLIKQASQRSAHVEFIWHGGEPLLAGTRTFTEILKIQSEIQTKKEVHFLNRVQTNATLIDNGWTELFKKGNFAIGVSLDGPQWLHDRSRPDVSGNGSYKDTMRGIQLLRDAGVEFSVLSVVTKESLEQTDEIFSFFVVNGFRRLDFLPCIEVRLTSNETSSQVTRGVSLDQGDFANFMIRIFDLWFESDDSSISIRYLEEMLIGLLGGSPSLCKFNGNCRNYVTVDYDGTVSACDKFLGYEEFAFGDLGRQSLDEILDASKRKNFMNAVSAVRPECLKCKYFPACSGGCSKYSYVKGRDSQGKNHLCEDRRKLFAHIFHRVREEHPLLFFSFGHSYQANRNPCPL